MINGIRFSYFRNESCKHSSILICSSETVKCVFVDNFTLALMFKQFMKYLVVLIPSDHAWLTLVVIEDLSACYNMYLTLRDKNMKIHKIDKCAHIDWHKDDCL